MNLFISTLVVEKEIGLTSGVLLIFFLFKCNLPCNLDSLILREFLFKFDKLKGKKKYKRISLIV